MNRSSRRFTPTKWSQILIPLLIGIILLGLLVTLVLIGLSLFGVTPA